MHMSNIYYESVSSHASLAWRPTDAIIQRPLLLPCEHLQTRSQSNSSISQTRVLQSDRSAGRINATRTLDNYLHLTQEPVFPDNCKVLWWMSQFDKRLSMFINAHKESTLCWCGCRCLISDQHLWRRFIRTSDSLIKAYLRWTHPAAVRTVAVSRFIRFLQIQRVEVRSGGGKRGIHQTRLNVLIYTAYMEIHEQLTSHYQAAAATSAPWTLSPQKALYWKQRSMTVSEDCFW